MTRGLRILALLGACAGAVASLSSCAALMKALSDEYTQEDPVTGGRVVNKMTLEQEIDLGKQHEAWFLSEERKAGHAVDADPRAIERVRRILGPIVSVCHLPKLPWRFHVVENRAWNALAIMGGAVFVYRGLLDDVTDVELAAVLGHEVAHITCRQISETISHEEVTAAFSTKVHGDYYKASYSTENEAEADRVGVLYMALAGFDPRAAAGIWERRHRAQGSNPGRYLYTHPLNEDRAALLRALGPQAARYYVGPGRVNPDWQKVLANNDVAPRVQGGGGGSDTLNVIGAALDAHLKHEQAKDEAARREGAAVKSQLISLTSVSNVRFANTSDGYRGVFADVRNGSRVNFKNIVITIYYQAANGVAIYQEAVAGGALQSGASRTIGTYFKNVQGTHRVAVGVTDLSY